MKKTTCWLGLLAALSLPSAQAVNQEIRALFQPDSSQPSKNVFINKTPNSGYCASYPEQCDENKTFSIQIPVRFNSSRAIVRGDVMALKVPANWRRLNVTNRETMDTKTVEVRIIGIGSKYVLSHPAADLAGAPNMLEGHRQLWTNYSWVNTPHPCQYSGVGWYGSTWYQFFWKAPIEAPCTKEAGFRIPSMSFDAIDFAYELRTPNPLDMSSGLYTGSLAYTLGPSGDFQMGPLMVPDDNSLILDFVLDVQHTLKVDLPPGGNRIALEPEGGWQRWLSSGRPPQRLFRDQTFFISASSRFKMYLECGVGTAETCVLFNEGNNYGTPFKVSVSLPGGLTDIYGRPVKQQALLPRVSGAIVFQPGVYVDQKPGILHFEIDKANTERIIKANRGDRYSGSVTVIWDSEI